MKNKRTEINRQINTHEVEVIRVTLERAATSPELRNLEVTAERLMVVGKCDCGCDSVDFMGHNEVPGTRPIADAIGITPQGGKVGVIVWGTAQIITGLEIYDLGAGDNDLKLPSPDSIQPFEKAAV
jgi:hypothetical protein